VSASKSGAVAPIWRVIAGLISYFENETDIRDIALRLVKRNRLGKKANIFPVGNACQNFILFSGAPGDGHAPRTAALITFAQCLEFDADAPHGRRVALPIVV
jgi:hypothetical protein